MLQELSRCAAVGNPEAVEKQIRHFLAETGADELIIVTSVFDHADRLRSYEITADIFARINEPSRKIG